MTSRLLELDNVSKTFSRGGLFGARRVKAVDGVSFSLAEDRPEIFTIIGESGSGKSTTARMILGIERPTSGRLVFDGIDVAAIRTTADRMRFMHSVQPIFQNPFEAFNPLKRMDRYLFLTARRFGTATDQASCERMVDAALGNVGLSLVEVQGRFPHEMSGGQLQRLAIARALLSEPRLIVADEPVSMVDASLRMSIVNLFKKLRDELKISIIYITHDLATAYYISDRLVIMQKGRVVESGDARAVLSSPKHPYSILLKSSVLSPDAAGQGELVAPDLPLVEETSVKAL
jgi:ABC-type oligopeptide transport system ATPase subunit